MMIPQVVCLPQVLRTGRVTSAAANRSFRIQVTDRLAAGRVVENEMWVIGNARLARAAPAKT